MDGGCAWLPMQRVVSRGVPSQFPLGGNTLPPPLLSNSRVYAREGREAKRHLSAAPEIFRRMVDVLTTVERRRCERVCMCDALYARNAEKPQFARARRTRDDPQTESGDNAMDSGGAVPRAVLAVTDELHGLGYLADVAVGTTLTYDSGRRNKVRLVAKIPTKTEDGGEARIELELKREDVWTLAFWPATEDDAVNARPEWSKLTEFRKRVAVAIMAKNEPPLHPEDDDLIDDRELEEMLSVVSWSEEERMEMMRLAYSPLKTPESVAMLRKLEKENASLKLQATTDKARAGLAKIEEEAESARLEAEDARRQLAAAQAEADERVRKAEQEGAYYIEKWKEEAAKSKELEGAKGEAAASTEREEEERVGSRRA